MKVRLTSIALALALLGALLMVPGSAVAQGANQVTDIPVSGKFPGGMFTGTLDITQFVVQNGEIVAQGLLSGTLARRNGTTVGTVSAEPVAIPITAAVPDPLDCTILHLTLGPLDLHLLGLRVQLNEVDLLVTGVPREGILGQLLCSLLNPLDFPNLFQQIADILNTILGLPV